MHEMAIAQSVIDIAFAESSRYAGQRISKIKLSVGEFSGVVKEALDFAFQALKKDTPAADAEIEIEVVKLRAVCEACGEVECRLNDLKFTCEACGQQLTITAGREMRVDYIDLDDGE
jgi:hydrogenase nickel incorporation protein HypA/HybF